MNSTTVQRQKLHPALWIAAISVTIASLVAVAAMTGVLPKSQASATPDKATAASVAAPAVVAALPTGAPAAVEKSPHRKSAARNTAKVAHYDSDAYAAARGYPPPAPLAEADTSAPPAICSDCGTIESVHQVSREGEGSGIGAVAGGVLGGALGNGVGQGNGRTLATLAGIVGGAFAGNKIEKNMHQATHYEVTVRFDDGTRRMFTEDVRPPWREGERVKMSNGALTYVS